MRRIVKIGRKACHYRQLKITRDFEEFYDRQAQKIGDEIYLPLKFRNWPPHLFFTTRSRFLASLFCSVVILKFLLLSNITCYNALICNHELNQIISNQL